jgi:hypothetical protein
MDVTCEPSRQFIAGQRHVLPGKNGGRAPERLISERSATLSQISPKSAAGFLSDQGHNYRK